MVVNQTTFPVQVKILQARGNLIYDQHTWINTVRFRQASDIAR